LTSSPSKTNLYPERLAFFDEKLLDRVNLFYVSQGILS